MVGPRKRLARQVASPGAEPAAPVPPSVSGAAARAARKRRVLLAVTGVLVASLLLQVALHCAAPRPTGKERRSGRTFGEFWPFYLAHLRQHDNPHNRALHVVGTTMALFLGIFQPGLLVSALAAVSAAYTTFSACYHSRYCAIAEVAALVVVHVVVGRLLFRHSFPALASIPVLVYAGAWLGDALFQHSAPHPASYPTLGLLGDLRLWWDVFRGVVRIDPSLH